MIAINRRILFVFMLSVVVGTLLFSGCGKKEEAKLVIADQFGLAYAPLEIMKAQGLVEKNLAERGIENVRVEYKKLGNTATIREAMVAGDLDIGFVAIPPFLLGKDKGMDWRIISGLSESPVGLVTRDSRLENVSQLGSEQRIILPQPGSIQHILLSMYTEREFGDATYFDKQLLTMTHPDGLVVMSNEKTEYLHFTTPPFLQKELELESAKLLLDGEECFGGEFTFIVGICPERVFQDKAVYSSFSEALQEAIGFMAANPEESLQLLLQAYEYSEAELRGYLADERMRFTTEVRGAEEFYNFLKRTGKIENEFTEADFFWEKQ